ncbi:MAG: hypothetical protein ACTIII_07650, partial [Brachybacterium alimentarium]
TDASANIGRLGAFLGHGWDGRAWLGTAGTIGHGWPPPAWRAWLETGARAGRRRHVEDRASDWVGIQAGSRRGWWAE